MKLIDLTHTFDANMPVYPGDPTPELKQIAFIGEHGYNDYCLHTGMHVGTHMDAPLHMIPKGAFMSQIPASQFFGPGRLIDARGRERVTAELLENIPLEKGDIVLVLTGWYKHFRSSDYYEAFPEIAPEFAQRLVAAGVSILGLDTPTPDKPPFPVHKILLSKNVLIIENLNDLELLLGVDQFEVIAAPVKFHCEAAPVRVIARMPN
jgi:kynurenine formamidase